MDCSYTIFLRESHIHARLDSPITLYRRIIDILQFDYFNRRVEIPVRYGGEPQLRILRCVWRRGPYPKPTIAKGWTQLVREKQLKVGDRLSFYVDDEEGAANRFRIEVHRRRYIGLFGQNIPTAHWDLIP